VDGFLKWLVSTEGQCCEQALFEVQDALAKCIVEPNERAIIWEDGEHLSIIQSANRIHMTSEFPLSMIESHIVGWLEMDYIPIGLTEQQMEDFEILTLAWTDDYQHSQRLHSNTEGCLKT